MKKKLWMLALMLVAVFMVAFAAPTTTAWADEDLNNPADTDFVNDEMCIYGGGGSTADNLKNNQTSDYRGYISANSGNGVSIATLATTPSSFRNGQISITTVGKIRAIGMDVIPDPTITNPYHAAIVPQNKPLSAGEANALSNIFNQQPNVWR